MSYLSLPAGDPPPARKPSRNRAAGWHSHPRGQILIAISGLGQVQAEGGEVRQLRPGDAIWAPPSERHWHGAVPGHDFAYTSIHPIDPATGTYADWPSDQESFSQR